MYFLIGKCEFVMRDIGKGEFIMAICNTPLVSIGFYQNLCVKRQIFMEFKYGREWFLCIISVIGFMYQSQVTSGIKGISVIAHEEYISMLD